MIHTMLKFRFKKYDYLEFDACGTFQKRLVSKRRQMLKKKEKITWSNSYLTVSAVSRMSEKRASQKSEINVFSPKQVVFVSFI